MKTKSTQLLFSLLLGLMMLVGTSVKSQVLDSLSSNFSLSEQGCTQQEMKITYLGNASANAIYTWNFGGAVVLSGSGQGPYYVKWETVGWKTVTLTVQWEGQTSNSSRNTHIMLPPTVFHMTGGGSYTAGGDGVEVGLSGSESGVVYKLRKESTYTGIAVTGTGGPISFGFQTAAGSYNAVAVGGCLKEMEGSAVVTILEPLHQTICMVTFDTLLQKNKIVWNKGAAAHQSYFNIYKETSQNEHYEKIGEVPFAQLSVFVDQNSLPLVKSDKYRISVTDSSSIESEKSAYHKTVHLNINAGIYGFNLMWNHYVGFEFLSYRIYRKIGEGAFTLIATVASNVDSYTDFYTTSGLVTYYLEVVRLEPCHPTKSTGYESVVSNTATAAPLGLEDQKGSDFVVYPNPTTDRLFVVLSTAANEVAYQLVNLRGQLVRSGNLTNTRTEFSLENLPSGIYYLRITTGTSTGVRKVVKD